MTKFKSLFVASSLCAVIMLVMSACKLDTQTLLGAGEIGVRFASAIAQARKDHPDDQAVRIRKYAALYCELREEKGLEWDQMRDIASRNNFSTSVVAATKREIDQRCGDDGS